MSYPRNHQLLRIEKDVRLITCQRLILAVRLGRRVWLFVVVLSSLLCYYYGSLPQIWTLFTASIFAARAVLVNCQNSETPRNKNLTSLFPHHRTAELLCPDRLTDYLQPHSHLSLSAELCRTDVPMHNKLTTLWRNEKLKWWWNRLVCDWHPSFFLIVSCWTPTVESFFLLTEKSGHLRQHGALTAPLQDGDEQSFSFYWGNNFYFLFLSPPLASLNLNFIANWFRPVYESL